MKKPLRFLICPGWVISANDGDSHFIPSHQLINLYGLDAEECLIKGSPAWQSSTPEVIAKLIPLRPSQSGHYQHPDLGAK